MLRNRPQSRVFALILFLILASAGFTIWVVWRSGYLPDFRPPLEVPELLSGVDCNGNEIDDCLDLVVGAREQIEVAPVYKSEYYRGGYPPDTESVCTDVVWRAFKAAGYDWKGAVDRDIAVSVSAYPRIRGESADPNIDFRRVPNLHTFLSRTATELTCEVKPWDADNLAEWQPGDLVIFGPNNAHIGIVSDKRRRDGVPLVIHHGWATPVEDHILEYWSDRITSHFRVGFEDLAK